jgi:hypothetical protein
MSGEIFDSLSCETFDWSHDAFDMSQETNQISCETNQISLDCQAATFLIFFSGSAVPYLTKKPRPFVLLGLSTCAHARPAFDACT